MEKLQYALDLFWDDMVGTVEQIDENVYSIAFYTLIDSHWDCIEVYLEKVTDYNYMITDGGNIISDLEMYGFNMTNKEDIARIKDILMPPILFDVKEKEFYAVVDTREDDGEGFEDLKKFMFKVYSFARTMSFIHQHFYYLKKEILGGIKMFGCWQIVTSNEEKKEFTGFLNIKNMNGTKYAEIRDVKEDNKAGNVLFIGHMGYVISIEAI